MRKRVLMPLAALALLLGLAALAGFGGVGCGNGSGHLPPVITGVVLADLDGDGRVSAGDRPIPGAVVGFADRIFTQADADGRFVLFPDERGILWVRIPDGYAPRPVWLHTRDIDGEVQFLLEPRPLAGPLRFVHASDPHAGVPPAEELRAALRQAVALEPAPHFLVVTGDLTQSSEPEQLQDFMQAVSTLPVPLVAVQGNHDWHDGGKLFRRALGPPAWSFDAGGVHFVVISGDAGLERSAAFLANDARYTPPGTPVVAFSHFALTLPQNQILYDAMIAAGVKHFFTGHYHANREIHFPGLVDHNVQPVAYGGIDLVPAGSQVVTVSGADVEVEPRFFVDEPQLELVRPAEGACVPPGALELLVSAELGAAPLAITVSIDGGAEIPLAPRGGWIAGATLRELGVGWHHAQVRARAPGVSRELGRGFCVSTRPAPALTVRDWRHLGGDPGHTGAATETIAPPLRLAWAAAAGGFLRGAPALAGGTLFVPITAWGSSDDGGVVALDAQSGTERWRRSLGAAVHGAVAAGGGMVYVSTANGYVHGLDAATGDSVWTHDLGTGLPPQSRQLHAGPTLDGDTVYAGHMYRMSALDAATGAARWSVVPQEGPYVELSRTPPAVGDGHLVLAPGYASGGVAAYALGSGEARWRHLEPRAAMMSAPATLAGGRAFFASADAEAFALDLDSGRLRWVTELLAGENSWSLATRAPPAVDAERVYVATQLDGLFALSRDGGELLWHADADYGALRTAHHGGPTGGFSSAPLVTGQLVWAASDDGRLRALDVATGVERWRMELGAPVAGALVPAPAPDGSGAGTLYVATFDGAVRALVSVAAEEPLPDSAAPPPAQAGPAAGCAVTTSSGAPGLMLVPVLLLLLALRRRKWRRATANGQ